MHLQCEEVGKGNWGLIRIFHAILAKHVCLEHHSIVGDRILYKRWKTLGFIIILQPMDIGMIDYYDEITADASWYIHNVEIHL